MKSVTKRWILPILAILSTVCLAFGIAACDNKPSGGNKDDGGDTGNTLAAPVIELDDETGTITWEAVDNADRYVVYEDGEQITTVSKTEYQIDQTAEGTYEYAVASYNLSTRETSAKSNTVTYTVKKDDSGSHDHVWTYDDMGETQHTKSCTVSGCTEVGILEPHNYDDDYDNECNDCGHVRSHKHSFEYEQVDENGHNKTCTTCDDIKDEYEEHVYDNPADEECNYCGYTRTITTPDKYVTLGVGSVDAVIPATGASLYVTFGSDVKADKTYVLEFISDTYGAFYQTNVEVKLGSTPLATFTNGVSDPEVIVLDGFYLSSGLVITQEGDEEIEVSLTLAEQVKTGEYTLQAEGEMLTIDVGAGVASLNVAFGNWVTNGKKYDLEFSSIAGDYDIYFPIYLEYYEGGSLKTAEYDPNATKTMTITVDTSHGLRVYFRTDGMVQSVSLKLTAYVEKPAVPGETKNNPIIKNTVAGTHSVADLQEAYFRLPAIEFDDKYKITFADTEGVEVKIVNDGEQAVWSGDILNRDKLGSKPASTYNYILVTAPEGVLCSFTLELYEEAEEYDLRLDVAVYAEIGKNAAKPAKFNLINVDSGNYAINIGSQSNLTFYVKVGSTTHTLGTNEYNSGTYSKTITIGNEEYISIYVSGLDASEQSIGNVQVLLTEAANDSPLELDQEYKTTFRGGQYDSNINVDIALKDVPKGRYVISFTFASNVSGVFVITPDKGSKAELGSTSSYREAQSSLVLDEGCTKITVSLKESRAPGFSFTVTILLTESPEGDVPIIGIGRDAEGVDIPYATSAVYVEFDATVVNNVNYRLRIKTEDIGSSVYVYYSYEDETNSSPSGTFEYNSDLGCYEYKFTKTNSISYVLIKHLNLKNAFDILGATISIVENKFGIGDVLDSASLGKGQIAGKDFVIEIDSSIPDGTKLRLTVQAYNGRNPANFYFAPRAMKNGSTWIGSTEDYIAYPFDGKCVIEFEKQPATITEGAYEYCGNYICIKGVANTYIDVNLILEAVESTTPGGGEEEQTNDGISLRWVVTESLAYGLTINLKLSEAESSGTAVGASLPAGDYTFMIKASRSFNYVSADITPAGGTKTVIAKDVPFSNQGVSVSIRKGCTSLTFYMDYSSPDSGSCTFTFWLLGKGGVPDESEPEGGGGSTGGTATSATKSVLTEGYLYTTIDVSELQFGLYSIKIEGVTADWLGNYPMFYASTDYGGQVEVGLNQGNNWTGTIALTGELQLWASDGGTVTVKLERIGDA